ncbi:MAG: sulfurtransferase TusA family protein [Anaerolineae bacterium]
MTEVVDARGLSCPQPVILTKRAMDKGHFPIEVWVDTVTSRENVRRLAEKAGLRVQIQQEGDIFRLLLNRS